MKNLQNTGNTKLVEILTGVTGELGYKSLKDINRKPNESHVNELMKSFNEFGTSCLFITVLQTKAFSGKTERYTADGQHSLIACNRLGLPYNVVIVELVDDNILNVTKFIATLNNNSKAWSTNNFLKSFAENGIREYKTFADIMQSSGLTITDLLYIFLGNGGKKENEMFKSGELKFINEADSMELLKATLMVKNIIPNKAFVRRSLYKIMRLSKDYNKMAKAIVKVSKAMETSLQKFSCDEIEFHNHLTNIYRKEFNIK